MRSARCTSVLARLYDHRKFLSRPIGARYCRSFHGRVCGVTLLLTFHSRVGMVTGEAVADYYV